MYRFIQQRYRSNTFLFWCLLAAAVWYGLISLVNHYCFRTYSLDLGLYTNALYDYAHFQMNDSLVFKSGAENLLADHLDLYLPLLSPLSYLLGTYTLPLIQIAAVLFGGAGVYRLMQKWFPDTRISNYALLYFLFFYGIISAMAFDYHSNVVATMFIPWLFLALENRQFRRAWIFVILIVIAKENMSLWLLFVTLGLSWKYRKDKAVRMHAIGMAVFALLYFVAVIGWIMPALSNDGKYAHFYYSRLGTNSAEALLYLLSHPVDSFKLLFVNHSGETLFDYVKAEMWVFLVLSGFMLLRKPVYLFMLIPIVAQKVYNDNTGMWGIVQQYAVEFAPITAIGTFDVIGKWRGKRLQSLLSVLMVAISIGLSVRLMDQTIAYMEKARIRVYKAAHYSREFSIDRAYEVMKLIPDSAAVSAQSAFVPHLALRDSMYTFPEIGKATYILISPLDNAYPLTPERFQTISDSLVNNPNWRSVYCTKAFILLKRK